MKKMYLGMIKNLSYKMEIAKLSYNFWCNCQPSSNLALFGPVEAQGKHKLEECNRQKEIYNHSRQNLGLATLNAIKEGASSEEILEAIKLGEERAREEGE